MEDEGWMQQALQEARRAAEIGEVPVGAVLVCEGKLIASAHNRRETDQDPLAHAEILVLREAARLRSSWRLTDCEMFVTLEPCAMCAGALVNSRVERVVFGASDPKAGYCGSLENVLADERLNHQVVFRGGVLEPECSRVLKEFFAALRTRPKR